MDLQKLTERCLNGTGASREEAFVLTSDEVSLNALYEGATRIREAFFGNEIQLCAILNARSGTCSENCKYCAQSAHHQTDAQTYPLLSTEEIVAAGTALSGSGATSFGIVTSGPTVSPVELRQIVEAVRSLRAQTTLQPCASLGALDEDACATLRDAGLRRYHHNLETSEDFYPSICSTHDWAGRIATVDAARRAGLEVCCGGLFGLGESWEERIDMALTLRAHNIVSIPINFLSPIPGTPLEHQPRLSPDEALRIVAVYRYLLPTETLRICGGRPATLGDRQRELFRAGANGLMTGNYLTTPGFTPDDDLRLLEEEGLVAAPASCQ